MSNEKQQKKPQEPLSAIYADAKQTITSAVRNVMRAYPLPLFMMEGILEGLLSEIKTEARLELSAEMQAYKQELESYHNSEIEDLENKHTAEKEELIHSFETSGTVTKEVE